MWIANDRMHTKCSAAMANNDNENSINEKYAETNTQMNVKE